MCVRHRNFLLRVLNSEARRKGCYTRRWGTVCCVALRLEPVVLPVVDFWHEILPTTFRVVVAVCVSVGKTVFACASTGGVAVGKTVVSSLFCLIPDAMVLRQQVQNLPLLVRPNLHRQNERGAGRTAPLLPDPHAARSQTPCIQIQNARQQLIQKATRSLHRQCRWEFIMIDTMWY